MKQPGLQHILLILILLAGCSKQSANTTEQSASKNDLCIPPVVTAIPDNMQQPRDIWTRRKIPRAPMPYWWSQQVTQELPFSITEWGQVEHEGLWDIAIRDGIMWSAFSFHVLKYDTETGETFSYEITDPSDNIFAISDILIDHDGEVWALASGTDREYVKLARYNPISDNFEIVSDQNGILLETGNFAYYWVKSQVLAESPDGSILFPYKKNIIAYNPQSNVASYLLPLDFSFPVAAMVVSNDKVWFTVGLDIALERNGITDLLPEEKDLRSIDLQTGELVDYGHTTSILDDSNYWFMNDNFRSISIDALGRVWMGYFSRLILKQDGSYTWEQIDLPPEFVVADDPDLIYLWAALHSVYTSSNGNLWFDSEAGLVEYDPEKDIWCKSMPLSGLITVTEDEEGNMWMALVNYGNYYGIYRLNESDTDK